MPKSTGLKFNLGAVKKAGKTLRDNGSAILAISAITGFGGLMITALTFAARSDLRAAAEREYEKESQVFVHEIQADFQNAASFQTEDGLVFSITGPHQITLDQGRNDYVIDFNTNVVTLDGPGQADAVYRFENFSDIGLIEQARAAGIAIADTFNASIDEALSAEEQDWLNDDREWQQDLHRDLEARRAMVQAFATNYGSP